MLRRTAGIVAATVVLTLGVAIIGLILVARTGAVNVAATHGYMPGAHWFFDTLTAKSIERHARKPVESGVLTEPVEIPDVMLKKGASEYHSMCVPCHGVPGEARGEFGRSMKPQPPDLAHTAREMRLREIYWVVEHGIRHTGMPAFGDSHSEEDLWAIAAFVKRFGDMSPEQYRKWAGEAASASRGHEH